jgi:hypothetical protein
MTLWWVIDVNKHRRGPFTSAQIALLIHLDSLKGDSRVFTEINENAWTVETCELLQIELLAQASEGEDRDGAERLPLSDIPLTESTPCLDHSCPKAPGCDVVYLWDRKLNMWLTFDEYVKICSEEGLTDGLPERALVENQDQMDELLRRTDYGNVISSVKTGPNKRGFIDQEDDEPLSDPEKEAKRQRRRAYRERRKLKRDAGLWLKTKSNPNIYISGLPADIQEEELSDLFKQSGQLKLDPETGEPKVKLYGHGDALVSFVHVESVVLSIQRFNEYEIRPGTFICVQEADFSKNEAETEGRQFTTEELREMAQLKKESQKKKLETAWKERKFRSAWDTTEAARFRPIVVFQNCFDPHEDVDYDYIESQIEEFCVRFGEIKSLYTIKSSLEGYICVKYADQTSANSCLVASCGDDGEPLLFVCGRRLNSFMHDGRDLATRLYSKQPQEALKYSPERNAMEWDEFLNDEDSDDSDIQIRTE